MEQHGLTLEKPVSLLLGIARLGETDLRGWWRARGFSEAGNYVLQGTFPRTAEFTALELDVISAEARHRQEIPRDSALHLFSDKLAIKVLAINWLLERKLSGSGDPLAKRIVSWNLEAAERDLRQWSATEVPTAEVLGAGLYLGSVPEGDLVIPGKAQQLISSLSICYLNQQEKLRIPYYNLEP